MRRWPLVLFAGAALVVAAGARYGEAAAPDAVKVSIEDFAFGPGTLTVKRGTTVTWTNKDDEPHTVVSDADPKLWKSPALDTDDAYSFTFDKAGTYKYFCSIHPRMQGTVVVQ